MISAVKYIVGDVLRRMDLIAESPVAAPAAAVPAVVVEDKAERRFWIWDVVVVEDAMAAAAVVAADADADAVELNRFNVVWWL